MTEPKQTPPHSVRIELLPVSLLEAHVSNPRTHSRRQIEKIATSIKNFGFTNPILIDENNVVLAGHGRLAAAKTLWMSEVPCRRLTDMTEGEKQAYVLADNKLSLDAGWDSDVLADSLKLLEATNFDLALTGFELPEIDDLLSRAQTESPNKSRSGEDDVPAVAAQVVCRPGDLWQLGRHRLICGDARDPDVVARLMADKPADMIFADPPYNNPVNGHVSGLGKVRHAEFAMASGEMSPAQFCEFLEKTLGNGATQCRDGAIAFVTIDWRHIGDLIGVGRKVFFELKNICVWNKSNAGMGTFYRSKHEFVAVFKIGEAPHTNTFGLGDKGRYRTNVWSYAGVNSFSAVRKDELARHPTSKPVAMVADAIRDVSHRGQIVLDMFGGSGTTLIAAQRTGRQARLVEISPAYCDVIIRRWQDYTGKAATQDGGNATFEDIAINRTKGDDK